MGSGVHAFVPFRDDQQGNNMTDDDNFKPDKIGMSRRSTLTLVAGFAALGMRSNALAQGKSEGKGGARERAKAKATERERKVAGMAKPAGSGSTSRRTARHLLM
jgi:hypothetical protein